MYIYNIYEFLKKVKNKSIKLWFCFVWFLFGFCLVFVWFCVDLLYAPTITSHIIVISTHLALISPVFLSGMLHKQLFTYNSRYASYTSLKVTDLSVRRFPSTTTVGFRINIWRPKYINSKMVSVARWCSFTSYFQDFC